MKKGGSINTEERCHKLKVKLTAITKVGDDIYGFTFHPLDKNKLPTFTSGAHIDVHINSDLIRQYSLCNNSLEIDFYQITVQIEANGKGGSKTLYRDAKIDQIYEISAPRNHFPLNLGAKKHLLIAGGIGITPLLAMASELKMREADFHLHYCARNQSKTIQSDELMELISNGKATIYHDNGDPSNGIDLKKTIKEYENGRHLYFCGPTGFMAAIKNEIKDWPKDHIHYEHFSAASHEQNLEKLNTEFLITLNRSKLKFKVAANESIIDSLRKNNFFIESSCEEGYCGTCLTRYLGGEPDHRDTVLNEKDRKDFVLICCSRSNSPELVLDL